MGKWFPITAFSHVRSLLAHQMVIQSNDEVMFIDHSNHMVNIIPNYYKPKHLSDHVPKACRV